MFVFTLILALVTDCALCLSKAPTTQCRAGWTYFKGSCYGFANVARTWHQAAASCVSHGAYLAEIESAEENNWLVNRLRTMNYGSVWIGGSKVTTRGTYVWAYSGRPIIFSDWYNGYPCCDPIRTVSSAYRKLFTQCPPTVIPGMSSEACVEIRAEYGYQWNDWLCDREVNRYVCETRPL